MIEVEAKVTAVASM